MQRVQPVLHALEDSALSNDNAFEMPATNMDIPAIVRVPAGGEVRHLAESEVALPVAFWLFLAALVGFVAMGRPRGV